MRCFTSPCLVTATTQSFRRSKRIISRFDYPTSSSLTRFKPDPRGGGGFVQELLKVCVSGGLEGLKRGHGVRDRIRKEKNGAKRSAKQAVKRKAYEVLDRNMKQKFNDIFGE